MKILNIYFKNINSLEGESRIHFDKTPISESGVFAITGPNGSGKSSILDVITLALYGETFRFDRPADHVMTKATTESFAEVEFLLGQDIYRSSWHVQRNKGDASENLLTPEMKLQQVNKENLLIEDNPQQVRNKIVELTGMDFHKFSKSMVLAQGDFSAFLNALDSERMDILEKISGVDIYQDYKNQAEESNSQAQTQLQQLEQDLNAIPILDDSVRESSEMDLADFKEQQVELKQQYDEVQQQVHAVQKIANLENQIELLTKQQKSVDSQLETNQQALDQVDAIKINPAFEQELNALDNKVEQTEQSKKTLTAYHRELELLQKKLSATDFDVNKLPENNKTLAEQKSSINQLSLKLNELNRVLPEENALVQMMNQHIVEKKASLELTQSWLQEHVADEHLLDDFPELSRLSNLKGDLAEASIQLKKYSKWSKTTTDSLKKKKDSNESLVKKNVDLEAQIEVDQQQLEEMSEGYSLDELEAMQIEQQQRVEQFQELHDLASVNTKLNHKGFLGQVFQAKGADREEQELTQEAEQLQLEIGKEQGVINVLEAAIFNEALLLKMQSDREHLHNGKACPLCGALDHPFLKYPPAVSNSKKLLGEQRKKLKNLNAKAKGLTNQIAAAKKQAEKNQQKDSQLEVIFSQWNSLANKLNVAGMDINIDKLSDIKELHKVEKTELSNLKNLIKKCIKQQTQKQQALETIEQNRTTLERLEKEAESLDEERENRPDESIELKQSIANIEIEVKKVEAKIIGQLSSLGEKIPAKEAKEAQLIERLNARKQDYYSRTIHVKTLTNEIQGLEKKIGLSLEKIDEIAQEVKNNDVLMQQEEQASLHLSVVEKQKLIADKEIMFTQQEDNVTRLKQVLLEQNKGVAEGDLNALREQSELAKSRPGVLQARLELTQKVNKIWKNIEQTQAELDRENAVLNDDTSADELLSLNKSTKTQLDICQQEVNTLQNKLSKQNVLQQKYDAMSQKVLAQKEITQTCEQEIKFISDEGGMHFRHKVQQGMVNKLLSESNQVLEKISGRFYVRQVESEHGLALEIEDTKQKNVRRLPKTLSGGESFIVSLALALGLAEMANNGHALDSLFLDEGFGNLDAEALYSAMTTLESLQTHGKVVGVISHVEGVRKRIKTQVKMIKKPNGMSALKVIS